MNEKRRIESVDVLRGFTIIAMILVNTPGSWSHVYAPLLHAEWHGLTPTDLIFPFFLFIVGISIYFAYKNKIPSKTVYKKILVRSVKLIGLGLFLNLFVPYFPFITDLETVRFPGVLQRIGVVFLIASVLYLNCNWKALLGLSIVVLVGYWLFLGFFPFPNEHGMLPTFDRAPNNWANYIDLKILGAHMWQPDYDPEGVLSTLPAVVTCISGILIGKLLDGLTRVKPLFLIALVLLISGYAFDYYFPINKAIWSSSFVLVTTGWGVFLLGVIYYLIDIKQYTLGRIFKYIGVNAITVYFLSSFISKCMYMIKIEAGKSVHAWLYETVFTYDFLSPKFSSLLYALVVATVYSLLAYYMFKKKIFIKV
ncbi:heparan-alpha-glucosaminide N-acetyltransferase domain-containing protein [Tamlana sp. 2201CG12-4]|uniref:acyltransferase family protein n=1 Tax=Tamlana sp. 2201CG12-4 TaxID=3112582 RepID=UPI002DB9A3F7|nr:heparan-alpha-glucosaminide N-acetyltransferase domain-containing protein [Tamlana sp. 2201CG12-4]MEC3906689.1 heparan-alpha-glucosaminide N-acetyltransferase domain-containing protein [Tamlana sp. 2201CG12-4]